VVGHPGRIGPTGVPLFAERGWTAWRMECYLYEYFRPHQQPDKFQSKTETIGRIK
jgi:hypothetical protein